MNETNRKTLGKKLQKHRQSLELSQEYIASILGLKRAQFISNVERGLALPPIDRILEFSEAYQYDYEKLMLEVLNCDVPSGYIVIKEPLL